MKTNDYIHALSSAFPKIEFASNHERIYDDFVRSLMHEEELTVSHPQEYSGQKVMKLVCSQHSMTMEYTSSPDPQEFERRQRKYTAEWVQFLNHEKMPVKEIDVCSSVNQKIFDALCAQDNLESLRIKRLTCKQIDEIVKLKNLKKLFLQNASTVMDISPLAHLENLEVLILGETKKVDDYSALASLKRLKVLGICGYQASVNSVIKVKDLDFISELPALEYVDFIDVRLLPN